MSNGIKFDLSKSTFSRVIPNNTDFATSILSFASANKWTKIYLVYGAEDFDLDMAQTILNLSLDEYEITIVENQQFIPGKGVVTESKAKLISERIS
jgi:hypothetical protein